MKNFNSILSLQMKAGLFSTSDKPASSLLIKIICILSLFENYVAHLKGTNSRMLIHPQLAELASKESLIKLKLNLTLTQFLKEKNKKYDIQDFNKALRQAAFIGDITVVKLLIYTYRANVNALSPTNKTTLDNAHNCTNEDLKKPVLKLLDYVNAKTGKQILAELAEEIKSAESAPKLAR